MPTKFILIGSGLAGGLLAAYLGRRGYEVDLYERRADPREGNMVGGRSINLALSTRGIGADFCAVRRRSEQAHQFNRARRVEYNSDRSGAALSECACKIQSQVHRR